MRHTLFLCFVSVFLFAFDIQTKGDVTAHYEKINYKHPMIDDNISRYISMNFELKTYLDDYKLLSNIIGLYDKQYEDKSYLKFNELYIQKEFENITIKLGRDIKYWGALELENISDIYNQKNTTLDRFDKDQKLGTDAITFEYFFQNDTDISFIASKYDDNITKYLKYSGAIDIVNGVDFAFIAKHDDNNTQYINYTTAIVGSNIFKLEYINTNTKNTNFYKAGIGYERTFFKVLNKNDIVILVEYYKSNIKQQNTTTGQDDIFAGIKYNFNDVDSSDIIFGMIKDMDDLSYSYTAESNTKFFDILKTKLSYIQNDFFKRYYVSFGYHF